MARALLPFYFHLTASARHALGSKADAAAIACLRAILRNGSTIAVAFQQITYAGRHYALSSRITRAGDLVVEIDVGDPSLAGRLITADELAKAERHDRQARAAEREAERRLRLDRRR
ncbi:MAG: hypothetical protein NW216_14475 [Hyphomicrobium sp.]|nr:hypothetical protein [Hyphomicrobium sp.]